MTHMPINSPLLPSPSGAKFTLATTTKPFTGEADRLQHNALKTWNYAGLPILLLGDDGGSSEAATHYGADHIPTVKKAASGMPLLPDLFKCAETGAKTRWVAYINADIMILPSFKNIAENAIDALKGQAALITVRRRNIAMSDRLTGRKNLDIETLKQKDAETGCWDRANAVDLFLFPKGFFGIIPDFTIGYMQWDNWLIWRAKNLGHPIIDLSLETRLLHPIHGYASDGSGLRKRYQSDFSRRNRLLANNQSLDLKDGIDHILIKKDVVPITFSLRQKLTQATATNPAQELKTGLSYLKNSVHTLNDAEICDCIRTILWRFGAFFPFFDEDFSNPAKIDQQPVQSADLVAIFDLYPPIDTAQTSLLHHLQDKLCAVFLDNIKRAVTAGRPLLIWGAGTAGGWLLSLLTRHGISVVGFIDINPALQGKMAHGLPVIARGHDPLKNTPKPLVMIATVKSAEVKADLEAKGFSCGIDFIG